MSDKIICPNCQFEIEVTEVLSAQLRTQLQKEFEADIRQKESALVEREKEVARAKAAIEAAQQDIDRCVAEQLAKERKQLSTDALATARGEKKRCQEPNWFLTSNVQLFAVMVPDTFSSTSSTYLFVYPFRLKNRIGFSISIVQRFAILVPDTFSSSDNSHN